jgi:hypothetical protein
MNGRTLLLGVVGALIVPRAASALTLPDTGSCNTSGSCLAITQNNTAGLGYTVTSSGQGVSVSAGGGDGIVGATTIISSQSSAGVRGTGTGINRGVEGYNSSSGVGVFGWNQNQGWGVVGSNTSSGTGVQGSSSSGVGVIGLSTTGIAIKGIAGSTSNGLVAQNSNTDGNAAAVSAISGSDSALAYWGTGGIIVTGAALKPGGGTWGSWSDARVKKDVKPYSSGLAELLRVRPVTYKYNGLGGTPDNGKEFVGVIAQELEKVSPAMVTSEKRKLRRDDREETDVKLVDPSAFTYMLINAVKAQEARLSQLERERSTVQSSMFPGERGIFLALGILVGVVVARRKQKAGAKT